MNECRGTCDRYRATRPAKGGRYANGQIRCSTCQIFLKPEANINQYCICCSNRIRLKPRSTKFRERLNVINKVKRVEDEEITLETYVQPMQDVWQTNTNSDEEDIVLGRNQKDTLPYMWD